MVAAISAMALRVGESSFGRWFGKAGDLIDRAIPLAIVTALAVGSAAIVFGLIE